MIKIAIADDHKLFREGLRFLMDQMDDLEVVFEASNGKELLEQMENHEPDVLLLDLDMPEVDGLEALKQLRPKFPNLGIIILTMHSDSKMVAYLMELGANSYLLKDTSPEEFRKAISSVIQEGFYFNKMVSQ
ncbi:MAG: response regulator transcription factor, partial [Roseivirga sp.]|nr:response regulator transcription factor [Roseivirga sp.]